MGSNCSGHLEGARETIHENRGLRGELGCVHCIPDSSCALQKPYGIEPLFTHMNGDFGAISVTEQSSVPPILKTSDSFYATLKYSVNRHSDRSGSK